MFTTIVAWAAFVGCSLIFVGIIADSILNRRVNKLEEALYGRRTFWNSKMYITVLAWFVSGWYLFG
jgi:hypothetical protein